MLLKIKQLQLAELLIFKLPGSYRSFKLECDFSVYLLLLKCYATRYSLLVTSSTYCPIKLLTYPLPCLDVLATYLPGK